MDVDLIDPGFIESRTDLAGAYMPVVRTQEVLIGGKRIGTIADVKDLSCENLSYRTEYKLSFDFWM